MSAKEDTSKLNVVDAEKICSSINEESSQEAELLLVKANKERQRILSEASKEAGAQAQAILSAAEKEVAARREVLFSTVNMEKRRVYLEVKSLFVGDVIEAVKREAEKFRGEPGYAKFLREAILEGIKIVDDKKAQVFYSHLDEALIPRFSDLSVDFKRSDFGEIGVIVQSHDGKLLFDNRFSARLKRDYDEIYANLVKEAF